MIIHATGRGGGGTFFVNVGLGCSEVFFFLFLTFSKPMEQSIKNNPSFITFKTSIRQFDIIPHLICDHLLMLYCIVLKEPIKLVK